MLKFEGKVYRNLQEQVKKNMDDIASFTESGSLLARGGIRIVGRVDEAIQLPAPQLYTGTYGDAFEVGTAAPYSLYIFIRPTTSSAYPSWFNLGPFPAPGPQGEQGEQGEAGVRGSLWYVSTGLLPAGSQYITGDMLLNSITGNVYRYNESGEVGAWEDTGVNLYQGGGSHWNKTALTIAPNEWINGSATKTVPGMTIAAICIIGVAPENELPIIATSQGINTLTFEYIGEDAPSTNVSVNVAWEE